MSGKTSKIQLDAAFTKRAATRARPRTLPGGWWLWCLVGLGLGLGLWIGGRRYLRSELARQLTSAQSEQEALASIGALMQLDGDAAADVSRALAHPDLIVAHAAYRALNEQLDRSSQLGAAEQIERMTELIGQLERVPGDCDQDHRILVTGLASRLYADALSSRQPGAEALLERCKRILDHKTRASLDAATAQIASPLAGIDGSPAPLESSLSDTDSSDLLPSNVVVAPITATLSDSAQSPRPSAMPRLSPSPSEAASSRSEAARVHLTGVSSRQATLVQRPAAMTLSDSDGSPPQGTAQRVEVQTLRAARPFDAAGDDESAATDDQPELDAHAATAALGADGESSNTEEMSRKAASRDEESRAEEEMLADIDNQPIDRLVRLLSSLKPRVAQAAALALRRKGMSDDKLELAMQLAAGSSAQRLDLLQSLGQRSDLDPRPWLLWMAADGDEAVREQAVGLLSPLLDQDVRRQLRLLLSQERDERVAQTIRQVLVR